MPKTREHKLKYIYRYVDSIPLESRREVGRLFESAGVPLAECAEGSVVNMDKVPSTVLEMVYRYLQFVVASQNVA